jgi:hypothetical protein
MSRLIRWFIVLTILLNINPALANSRKSVKTKSSPTASDSVNSGIFKILERGKKYRNTQLPIKSQLETQNEYENRIAASKPNNIETIKVIVPPKAEFKYDAEDQALIVSMADNDSAPSNHIDRINVLMSDAKQLSRKVNNIICTNAYGARFNYKYTGVIRDYYGIAYFENEAFLNKNDLSWSDAILSKNFGYTSFKSKYDDYSYGKFSFKIPISVDDARNYITSDEQNLNDKLKFVLELKPSFPFYAEDDYSLGNQCGFENSRGGFSYTWTGRTKYAIFDLSNLKIVDYSSGKIWYAKNYIDNVKAEASKPFSTNNSLLTISSVEIDTQFNRVIIRGNNPLIYNGVWDAKKAVYRIDISNAKLASSLQLPSQNKLDLKIFTVGTNSVQIEVRRSDRNEIGPLTKYYGGQILSLSYDSLAK